MELNCKNCGALISDSDHKCPYCEGINYVGARKKYFRDLNTIKDNLEDLDDIPVESYKREASDQFKRIIKTIIICAIIVVVIYGVISLFSKLRDHSYDINLAEPKDQLMWDRKYFPMLDEWYEAGEYDKLLEYSNQLYSEDPIYTYSNWKHDDFLYVYETYSSAMDAKNIIENKRDYYLYDVTSAIHGGLAICYNLENDNLDKDEIARLEVYKPEMETLLFDTLKFTEEEAFELYEKVSDEGFLNYIEMKEYAEVVLKRLD